MKIQFMVTIMRLVLAAVVATIAQVHAAESDSACTPGEKKSPPWLLSMDITQAKQYTSQQWYSDWLLTTTSLCTDLTRVTSDNMDYKQIFWRTDRSPLFRGGAGRTPEDIFTNGFYPWKANGSLTFPTGANNKESALTNTGYQPGYTFGLGTREGSQGYVIDAPGGIDQDGSEIGEPQHNVVVFPGGIRRERIKGAFTRQDNQLIYLPNPWYAFGQPPDGEFDLVPTPWDHINGERFSNARITLNPQGEEIGWIGHRYRKGSEVTLVIENGQSGECWYVNGEKKSSGDHFLFTAADQKLPVVIVYRAVC